VKVNDLQQYFNIDKSGNDSALHSFTLVVICATIGMLYFPTEMLLSHAWFSSTHVASIKSIKEEALAE